MPRFMPVTKRTNNPWKSKPASLWLLTLDELRSLPLLTQGQVFTVESITGDRVQVASVEDVLGPEFDDVRTFTLESGTVQLSAWGYIRRHLSRDQHSVILA